MNIDWSHGERWKFSPETSNTRSFWQYSEYYHLQLSNPQISVMQPENPLYTAQPGSVSCEKIISACKIGKSQVHFIAQHPAFSYLPNTSHLLNKSSIPGELQYLAVIDKCLITQVSAKTIRWTCVEEHCFRISIMSKVLYHMKLKIRILLVIRWGLK